MLELLSPDGHPLAACDVDSQPACIVADGAAFWRTNEGAYVLMRREDAPASQRSRAISQGSAIELGRGDFEELYSPGACGFCDEVVARLAPHEDAPEAPGVAADAPDATEEAPSEAPPPEEAAEAKPPPSARKASGRKKTSGRR